MSGAWCLTAGAGFAFGAAGWRTTFLCTARWATGVFGRAVVWWVTCGATVTGTTARVGVCTGCRVTDGGVTVRLVLCGDALCVACATAVAGVFDVGAFFGVDAALSGVGARSGVGIGTAGAGSVAAGTVVVVPAAAG